jgi:2-keto-4-pentenoate hydratase
VVRRHHRAPAALARGDARLASAGERLDAGDVISTGTMPGCCGLEHDRWIQPGQTVELEIDGGTLTIRVNPTAGGDDGPAR